ncbi:TPA: hypothetical protein DEP58_03205 [Patescibacteria group bacterium]|nr:MAG: hypothetical protein UU98_C0028G0006 [Parcubacteria group bacterium GW2011_GWD2_42_14]HCC05288.1 hypothetical protein [Patescibacteria group bacterium]
MKNFTSECEQGGLYLIYSKIDHFLIGFMLIADEGDDEGHEYLRTFVSPENSERKLSFTKDGKAVVFHNAVLDVDLRFLLNERYVLREFTNKVLSFTSLIETKDVTPRGVFFLPERATGELEFILQVQPD